MPTNQVPTNQSINQNHSLDSPASKYWLGLLAFWGLAFILNAGPHWEKYTSTRELIETAGMATGLQIIVALITIKILLPKFLNQQRWFAFFVLLFTLVVVASEINIVIRYLYLEQRYPDSYKRFLELFGHMNLYERMDLRWSLRYIVFTKLPLLLSPAAILIAYDFYTKQQTLLRLKEQKKTAELDALKNQLNPHFIFNTLNNIYALALKKSDQAPEAIEKLSAILDYVVYRCNDKFVPLDSEIALIKNYIALEKLRYGKRLNVTIDDRVTGDAKIAPLILLTLLENACKHGTREELNEAKVSISLESQQDELTIKISNSKPKNTANTADDSAKVGLANLRKQLALLYPGSHQFQVDDSPDNYTATLVLTT